MRNIMAKELLVHSCRVYSDKFHELCCSHLFCRIIDTSPHKSISNDEIEHTIVKSSLRRSKQTSFAIFGVSMRVSLMDTHKNPLDYSGTITKQEF